jgi:hypothetical protein
VPPRLEVDRDIVVEQTGLVPSQVASYQPRLEKSGVPCRQVGSPCGYSIMEPVMTGSINEHDDLLRWVKSGDERALVALITTFRERLKRMV